MFTSPGTITGDRDGDDDSNTDGDNDSNGSVVNSNTIHGAGDGACDGTGSVTGGTVFNAPRPITDRRDGDSDGGDNFATEEGSSITDGDDDGEAFGNVGNGSKILDD